MLAGMAIDRGATLLCTACPGLSYRSSWSEVNTPSVRGEIALNALDDAVHS
ncbi:hypothetical protein HMPREF0043_00108 [Actinobaculum sp. oral taxon 183 str. F0552]|nr:hypothetical protein HMPREF0043_00108 [Actinobaculum sp. oral taxon 183 str. F0552]